MKRALLLAAGPVLLLACTGLAWADPLAPSAMPDLPIPSYVLSLGPYGLLVWGAYLVGKGVTFTITVEISEKAQAVLERIAAALEEKKKEATSG